MKKYVICGLLLAAGVATWERADRVRAQADVNLANGPEPAPAVVRETVDHIYDLRDLIKPVKNYPRTGGPLPLTQLDDLTPQPPPPQQQNGAQPQPAPSAARQELIDNSIRLDTIRMLITDKVDKTSWKDNGGTVGSIAWFDGQLLVMQTVENQKGIQTLLDELRASRSRVVRVRADWLLLSPGQIEKLQKSSDDSSAVPEISRDQLRALPENTVRYSGSILCFSGQTVSISSGRAKSLVTGLTPVSGYEMASMTPAATYVQEGLSLQVTPTVIGDSATLDLASILTAPNKFAQHPTTMPAIDRVDSDLQHLHTTVQIQLGKPVLVAATTADPNPQEPAGKQLYLIIEADASK